MSMLTWNTPKLLMTPNDEKYTKKEPATASHPRRPPSGYSASGAVLRDPFSSTLAESAVRVGVLDMMVVEKQRRRHLASAI